MDLTLTTTLIDAISTQGMLDIDGLFECYTLELPFTDGLPGGAIPAGERYRVVSAPSPKFLRLASMLSTPPAYREFLAEYAGKMPHIEGITGRSLIMFHWGNYAGDLPWTPQLEHAETDGCVLVGQSKGVDIINASRPAFAQLHGKIYQPMIDGNCFLTVAR